MKFMEKLFYCISPWQNIILSFNEKAVKGKIYWYPMLPFPKVIINVKYEQKMRIFTN